jgi:hypothetical protein
MSRYSIGAAVGKKTGKLASSLSKVATGFDKIKHVDEMAEVELQSISDKISAVSDAISLTSVAYEGYQAKQDFEGAKKSTQEKVAKADYEKLSGIEKQKLSPGGKFGGEDWDDFVKSEGGLKYLEKYEPVRVEESMLDKILKGEHYKIGEKEFGRTAISTIGGGRFEEMKAYEEYLEQFGI